MIKGSCLCAKVQVEISGEITDIIHCHCSRCRKNSGTAYATNGFVNRDEFLVRQGESELQYFQASETTKRYFCGCCASPIYSANSNDPERFRVRLGIIDTDISARPMSHNFVDSKANWEDLDADLPRYPEYEPARQASRKPA